MHSASGWVMASRPSGRRAGWLWLPGLVLLLALGACGILPKRLDGSASETVTAKPASAPAPATDLDLAWAQARAAMQRQDWSAALTMLTALSSAHPELPGPAVNLGIAQARLQKTAEARRTLETASQRFPAFAPAQDQLGRLLAAQGEFEAADSAYAKAIAIDARLASAHYHRAVLNELYLQRPSLALQHYEAYQGLQATADKQVAGWITALRRRSAPTGKTGGDS